MKLYVEAKFGSNLLECPLGAGQINASFGAAASGTGKESMEIHGEGVSAEVRVSLEGHRQTSATWCSRDAKMAETVVK